MVPPLLKLVFLKGPREGETIDYKPGSTVRVGRIVRGNNLAIKDAGISTKHLRIESESGKWMIQDLGSSNGTVLNSTSLPTDTPFDLCHGDTIKLGECTSIVVNFETDAQDNDTVQGHKLPPKPRRNNRRQAVLESGIVGLVQELPSSRDNDGEQEMPRRSRVSRSGVAEDAAEEVKVLEEKEEKKVNSRVTRTKMIRVSVDSCLDGEEVATAYAINEDDAGEERQGKRGNSRVWRSRNTESTQSSRLDSGNLKIDNVTKGMEKSEIKEEKRATRRCRRSKQIETAQNSCSRVASIENAETAFQASENNDGNIVKSRITRSKKNEIPGDSYLELDIVESQARKRRAGKKKKEEKLLESVAAPSKEIKDTAAGEEARIPTVEEGMEKEQYVGLHEVDKEIDCRAEKDCNEAANDRCEEGGSEAKSIEQVQLVTDKTALTEEGESCRVREELEQLQDQGLHEEHHGANDKVDTCKTAEARSETSSERNEMGKGIRMPHANSVDQVEVDLGKMTLGQWFDFLEVHLPKQIIEETEKMIEPMRSKTQRVYEYIMEQKKVKGKEVKGKRPVG